MKNRNFDDIIFQKYKNNIDLERNAWILIGRQAESDILKSTLNSEHSEFVAVYGRRRVGKTFLIREFFDYSFAFSHSGIYLGDKKTQLEAFRSSLTEYGIKTNKLKNWFSAFESLKEVIKLNGDSKKVIFIDELSWMDSAKSDLIPALEHFWNSWASARKDIILIVCSSVTSWMLNKIIHNKGGLYNRLTKRIYLRPFSLNECKLLANFQGMVLTDYQIMELYMVLGGIPYYWEFLRKDLSVVQNIDNLFFAPQSPLGEEYKHLFGALFKNAKEYELIIQAISKKKIGLTRNEIIESTKISGSGAFSEKLSELESCDFIRNYTSYGKKKKDSIYQLIDPFLLFYYHFLYKKPKDPHFFTNQVNTSLYNSWIGLAFENLCILHVDKIKASLGISGVATKEYPFNCKADEERGIYGTQIDLVLERQDRIINLIEIKFSSNEYIINKKTRDSLMRKKSDFINATGTKSAVHLTMITPLGIEKNSYEKDIQSHITGDAFFT